MSNFKQVTFKQTLSEEDPLQLVGVTNPLIAMMAEQTGFRALYLSGAGVANADLGLPDLALTSLDDVLIQVRRITSRVNTPLIVDADTGWGSPLNVSRTFYELSKAGAAGAHIEDQGFDKRCGHRDGKRLVSKETMGSKIKAALDGRINDAFTVIARTDALAVEGVGKTLERAHYYQEMGAEVLFLEAPQDISVYKTFAKSLSIPILANITEFGKTPLYDLKDLKQAGVRVVLHPLSVFRAMNFAALQTLQTLKSTGSTQTCLPTMQTREALYQLIQYHQYEQTLDQYIQSQEREHE